jgi:hypothetical protein
MFLRAITEDGYQCWKLRNVIGLKIFSVYVQWHLQAKWRHWLHNKKGGSNCDYQEGDSDHSHLPQIKYLCHITQFVLLPCMHLALNGDATAGTLAIISNRNIIMNTDQLFFYTLENPIWKRVSYLCHVVLISLVWKIFLFLFLVSFSCSVKRWRPFQNKAW